MLYSIKIHFLSIACNWILAQCTLWLRTGFTLEVSSLLKSQLELQRQTCPHIYIYMSDLGFIYFVCMSLSGPGAGKQYYQFVCCGWLSVPFILI